MMTTAQRLQVPPGFSGWWCEHCAAPAVGIPEDMDAAQARCGKCRHWSAWWIPAGLSDVPPEVPASKRERAGEQRALSAGAPWERKQPRPERAKDLFNHIRAVMENPDLNPDLRVIEKEEYER